MLTEAAWGQRLKIFIAWLASIFLLLPIRMLAKRRRFVLLSSRLTRRQLIFDKKTKRIIHVSIREKVDFYVIEHVFLHNVYGLQWMKRGAELELYYQILLKSGKTPLIIDCGANCGMATRYFSEAYPGAHIVAIEPDASNMQAAMNNNDKGGVTFLQGAVGCEDGRGKIFDPGQGHWALRIEPCADGDVEIFSIESVLNKFQPDQFQPFLIKVDIEGFERDLFRNNVDWLDKFPVMIAELHDWMLPRSGSARNLLQQLGARDRDFLFRGENIFSISNSVDSASPGI